MEQKNGAVVRRSTFNYRYDTVTELGLLNELWPLVNLLKNLFPPTKKVTGYHLSRNGKSLRSYDDPRTPADWIKDTGIMLEPQRPHMDELYVKLGLAGLANRINEIQQRLIRLADVAGDSGLKSYNSRLAANGRLGDGERDDCWCDDDPRICGAGTLLPT